MSFLVPDRQPSLEALDDQDLAFDEMAKSLADLAMVNRFCGSSRALAAGIIADARTAGVASPSVLDVGAGAGDVSRRIAGRLARAGLKPRMIALDRQWRHLASGRCRSERAVAADAFALPMPDRAVDWVVSTLVFHHFSPAENVGFLRELARVARHGVAILDVRRHRVPLLIVSLAGRLLFRTRVSVHDGMASVLQAYTAEEARRIARQALPEASVRLLFPYWLLISANPNGATNDPLIR
jgi:SAM-dependent methyltransferase